ncbi:MAG: hypothetical protein ABIV10_16090 [Gemmatimonadaceae bacterium]
MRTVVFRVALFAMSALGVFAACSSTEPRPDPLSLEGRWIVSTSLDTFMFETGVPSPPDCPSSIGMYCSHRRADTTGRLSIVMTIAGDSVNASGARQFRLVSDSVSGLFCDQIASTLSGCGHVSPIGPTYYPEGRFAPTGDPLAATGATYIRLDGINEQYVGLSGTLAGDSIVGRLYWTQSFNRFPPAYAGSFTARRQR